jgi:pentose-5-phosphate-3-epimerase
VGVTTFDVDGGVAAVQAGADIVIIGHPYFTGPDGEATLTEYVQRVKAARPVKAGLEQF